MIFKILAQAVATETRAKNTVKNISPNATHQPRRFPPRNMKRVQDLAAPLMGVVAVCATKGLVSIPKTESSVVR